MQNFVDKVGPAVSAQFLNGVDSLVNGVFGGATTAQQVRQTLFQGSPLEIANGGTGAADAASALANLGGLAAGSLTQGSIGKLLYPVSTQEQTLGVTPSNFAYPVGDPRRYGVDTTGAVDCVGAITTALSCYSQVRLPPGTYKIDGSSNNGVITIPAGCSLWALPGTVVFNVTANAGQTASSLGTFQLSGASSLLGVQVNYPQQALTDNLASIIRYPPTIVPAGNSWVKAMKVVNAYVFASFVGSFGESSIEGCVVQALFRGLDFSDPTVNMGDTSRCTSTQVIMTSSTFGFNGGAIDTWCRQNAIGVNCNCTGGNRVDGYVLTDFNVVGGSLGYNLGNGAWFFGNDIGSDICTQAINLTSGAQFYIEGLWASLQDSFYTQFNVPAIRVQSGTLRITGSRIGMLAGGAQNAVFVDSGTVDLVNVKFATSKGGFSPAVFNQSGVVTLSNCLMSSIVEAAKPRLVTWGDVVVGQAGGTGIPQFWIDGKGAPVPRSGLLNLTNFGMASWSGGAPVGWTTNVAPANYGQYFQNLQPIDGSTGVQVGGAGGSGAWYLDYQMQQSADDGFGYYLLVFGLQVTNPAVPTSGFTVGVFDNSGVNSYTNNLCWTGGNLEPLAIPLGVYFTVAMVLCAPAGQNPSHVRFSFNFLTAASQTYRIRNLSLFGMGLPRECMGNEYWAAQSSGLPRDIQLGPIKQLLRAAPPTGDTWALGDTILNSASPVSGTIEWKCTTAGAPGVWTGITIP